MRDTFLGGEAGPPWPGRANLARFARLTLVAKSAGHEVGSLYSRHADCSHLVG